MPLDLYNHVKFSFLLYLTYSSKARKFKCLMGLRRH